MAAAHIDNPDCLSNSFTYALLDNTHGEDIYLCQGVPTSGKYIGHFLYGVNRKEIQDELDLKFEKNEAETYNVYGSGFTKEFGPVEISGIFDCGILTINKIAPSLAPSPPPPAPSPPTPCRTSKRQRRSNVLHDDFVVRYTESGDLVEDDEDEVDEDELDVDEYESDLESGSAEDEVEYESDLESGSDIEGDASSPPPVPPTVREPRLRSTSSNDTTIDSAVLLRSHLCGRITHESSSTSRVLFSGEWMPDEDSTQRCPFYYSYSSTSLIEPGTYTGCFCLSTNEVINDEFSIDFYSNRDGTYQVYGGGKNRFGSFSIYGRYDGDEMILHRTYTHVEEDTADDEPQPLFSGESFADMKCPNRDCNHNHVSPSESSEGVVDDEVGTGTYISSIAPYRSYSLHFIETPHINFDPVSSSIFLD